MIVSDTFSANALEKDNKRINHPRKANYPPAIIAAYGFGI